MRRVHGHTRLSALASKRATREQVADWFAIDPATGVGVITGEASGVAVRDHDDGLPAHLPACPTVASPGRGGQVYCQIAGAVKTRRLADGELRGDGSYVVAPPSVHPNGGTYSWLTDLSVPLAPLDPDDPVVAYTAASTTCNQLVAPRHTYRSALVHEVATDTSLTEWCKDAAWVGRAAEVMGLAFGRGFRCVLPGHRDTRPSANLFAFQLRLRLRRGGGRL
jgi:hypothetical protein